MTNFSQPAPQAPDTTQPTEQPQFTPEPLPQPPVLPFLMQANLTGYRKKLGVWRILVAIILVGFIFMRFGYIAGLISTGIIIVTLVIVLFYWSKRSVTLRNDEIEYRGAFGTVRRIRYEDISMVKVFLAYIEPTFGHSPRVIIGKKSGGPFFSFSTLFWKPEDIDLMLATLESKKVVNESYAEPAVSAMIAKQFPDYVNGYERHPYLIAFGIVVDIVVIVTAVVLVLM